MKMTTFEISKKLAEIGFKANFDWVYEKGNKAGGLWNWSFEIAPWNDAKEEDYYPAYDLETLLEFLPEFNRRGHLRQGYLLTKGHLGYLGPINEGVVCQENESLADCAARLLILLHEKGLIKFGE